MARLSASERARHQAELAAAFRQLLGREAGRVAEHLRHRAQTSRALNAAADAGDWWDDQRATDETAGVLRPAIHAAAAASAGAVAAAYDATYHPDAAFDSRVKAQVDVATRRTADTTRSAFAELIDDAEDDDEAADAIDRYGGLEGRADLIGLMEVGGALAVGGMAALAWLADRPDEDRVSAKTWVLASDHDGPDECDDADGETVGAEDAFSVGDDPPLHMGCGCDVDYALVSPDELTAAATSPAPAEADHTVAAMGAPVTAETPSDAPEVVSAAADPQTPPAAPDPPASVRIPGHVMRAATAALARRGITLELGALTAAADGSVEVGGGGSWHAVLTVEGIVSSDKREFAPGALSTRELPLPLMYMTETGWGHEGARLCGAITATARDGARITGEGIYDTSADGAEAQRLVSPNDAGVQMLRFVSVDAEVLAYEIVSEGGTGDEWDWLFGGGDMWERYTEANVLGATICPFPAFPQAVIAPASMDLPTTSADEAAAGVSNGPLAIAAGAGPDGPPPAAWFADPQLSGPTHLSVGTDGRVFGHVATWGQAHVGYSGRNVFAPRSKAGYAYFATGVTQAAGESEPVEVHTGPIVLGTSHAGPLASHPEAMAHYDDTGYAVADVACGEDEHGIWVAGALRATATEDQVRVLRASDVSGDWRKIGGNLELIGVLTVNAPGFPIPRSLAASAAGLVPDSGQLRVGLEAGEPVSLVAAGVLRSGPWSAMAALARKVAELEAITTPLRDQALRAAAGRMVA